MKVNEYYAQLREMIKNNPKILDFECIYSIDDEGNAYKRVDFSPEVGEFDEECNEFYTVSKSRKEENALCIN